MFTKVAVYLFKPKPLVNAKVSALRYATHYESVVPKKVLEERQKDMPIEMENPFEREKPMCILCKYKVTVNYKNVRLLSQFVSRHTGRVYPRHINGLCERQQNIVEQATSKARRAGLMPYTFKEPIYNDDPKIFNPERPIRNHKY